MNKYFSMFCFLFFTSITVIASQLPDYPFIHAEGGASIYLNPDIGEIGFEITVSDQNAEIAAQQLSKINNSVLNLLTEQNIPPSDIEIYELKKKLRTVEGTNVKPETTIVDLKQGIQITVRDLTKWESLIGPLLIIDNLGDFYSSFDRTDRQKIKDDLTSDAIRNAQHNGNVMAAGVGKHLGAVVGMSEGKLKDLGFSMGLTATDRSETESQRLHSLSNFSAPAAIKFSEVVDVIFKIK